MKREIADLYGDDYADLAAILNDVRGWAKSTLPTFAARRDFFEAIVNGDPDPIALLQAGDRAALHRLIAERQAEAESALV
jgi:precorrin-2 dehydrogenase / sirohydrochlorin ferrochelatase